MDEHDACGGHSAAAKELFLKGYNCCQSVFAAFCDVTGIGFEDALKTASSFGGGMGRLREVCGAVSGMFLVVGTLYGYADPRDIGGKTEHYRLVQTLAARFTDRNGSLICRELLGLEEKHNDPLPEKRTETYYKARPCAELVAHAAEIVDEYIRSRGGAAAGSVTGRIPEIIENEEGVLC